MDKKAHGIVYTPHWIVAHILRHTIERCTRAMRVCDPACGDGAFLSAVVDRLCDELPSAHLAEALHNIWGFDIDEHAIAACRQRLNRILAARGIRETIDWNLRVLDATCPEAIASFTSFFDYIIGNPPYVRIQHLGAARRQRIQQHWRLASRGSTDLYIAFFEIGMRLLRRGGRLGFITANTYTKSQAGACLRRFILSSCRLHTMMDFGSHQVFDGATLHTWDPQWQHFGS